MMTGLMVIFMFIAINYILQVFEYKFVENEIYNSLNMHFQEEINNGILTLGPDGTIGFNPQDNSNLFELGEYNLSQKFKSSLNEFIPKYIEIIILPEYIDNIREIRIEGHTDCIPLGNKISKSGYDNYENNLWLSSERAQSVLRYIRGMDFYNNLDDPIKSRLEFLFTANGLSYSRALNKSGEIAYVEGSQEIYNKLSRRVEFRVVTSNEKLANKLANN
jgi:outer membrane protein OmpA-like peptidoglycan-associated protein